MFLWFERSVTPAWGLFGGGEATPPVVVVIPAAVTSDGCSRPSRYGLRREDVIRTMTGGGGGFGPPDERDASLVELTSATET